MTPAKYNITPQIDGDSFDYVQFNLVLPNSTPINLTGVSLKIQFRKENKRGKLVKEITDGNGITWLDQILGKFKINTFIIDWGVGSYYYDIQFTYSDGTIKTYVQGKVEITEQVTR